MKNNSLYAFYSLTKRHILIFFKNKLTVLFTLMVPISILIIYILFLRPMELNQISAVLDNNLKDLLIKNNDMRKINGIVDSWMIAGVLAVSCITVSLNSCNIQIRDKENGALKDFISSPINSPTIMLSYFTFNVLVTFFINLIVFIICLIYLLCYGAFLISTSDFFILLLVLLYSTISASLVTFFVCSFINTESMMASIVAIFSAGIGFLIGAYLPTNMLPKGISFFTTFFPGTYSAGLFRNFFMSGPMDKLEALLTSPQYASISNSEEIISSLKSSFSFNLNFFNHEVTPGFMALAIFLFILLFAILNFVFSSKHYLLFSTPIKKIKKKKEQNKTLDLTNSCSPIYKLDENIEKNKDTDITKDK